MSLHRLDLCTLTAETAWREYCKHVRSDRYSATMALMTHFKRGDQRLAAKCATAVPTPGDVFGLYPSPGMMTVNPLDHTAKGKGR